MKVSKIEIFFVLKSCIFSLFSDRYFRCEPMDATVSPIALTSQTSAGGGGAPATPAGNSNGSSSNPGTPTN